VSRWTASPTGDGGKRRGAIARRHARGASDAADDLAQELALAALEGRAIERPGAWLERVGRNAAIDGWRAERRRRDLARDVDAPAPPPDPEARVLAHERRGVLRRALTALPRPLRRAALARYHGDLPFDAIAARLGTRPVTARTRVHRALQRLRARVDGLRSLVAWFPGAQTTALGVTLVLALAGPALPPPASEPPAVPPKIAAGAQVRQGAGFAPPAGRPAASPSSAPRPAAAARATGVEKPALPPVVQRFSYEEDPITGELARPDEQTVVGETASSQPSMIELRWTLQPEILKTFEDL
jgi:RNA polymerase sigma factor (sigma-70 family)